MQDGSMQAGWTQYAALFLCSASRPGFADLITVGLTEHRRERSKSDSMMWPSSRTRTFSGLRSRYIIPSICRYSRARSTSAT
uniref:Uncharacterized protein n=1 Tax=Arundo donax TaxID=35708 RepID=A0A0A9CXW6_ARUDO